MSKLKQRKLCSTSIILLCIHSIDFLTAFQPLSEYHASNTKKYIYNGNHKLFAKPSRLEENEEGILYVNDRCINCAACSYFAPETFERSSKSAHHIVYNQPLDPTTSTFQKARTALAACPVSAIRVTSPGEDHGKYKDLFTTELTELSKAYAITTKNKLPLPFPKKINDSERKKDNVWMLGHHSEKSFGAIPYLVRGYHKNQLISIMIDVPKFSKSAFRTIEEVLNYKLDQKDNYNDGYPNGKNEPDFMFLTHVDDTADHNQWHEHFPNIKRIFHSGDLGKYNWIGDESLNLIEILLTNKSNVEENKLTLMTLDETSHIEIDCNNPKSNQIIEKLFELWDTDFVIIHIPGHSPGSIALLHKPRNNNGYNTLFTGDTFSFTTRNGGHMSGFPRYGNNLFIQSKTLECLKSISSQFNRIAPGHGHPKTYQNSENDQKDLENKKHTDFDDAIKELRHYF